MLRSGEISFQSFKLTFLSDDADELQRLDFVQRQIHSNHLEYFIYYRGLSLKISGPPKMEKLLDA